MDFSTLIILFVVVAAAPAVIAGAVELAVTIPRILAGIARAWQGYWLRLSERKAALARASYGAVMLYAAAFEMAPIPSDWRLWVRIALIVLGSVWLVLGFGWKSRGPRDGNMIFGYLVKIGIGLALLYLIELPYEYDWLDLPMHWVALWCLITGGVKLALVLRGFPAMPPVDPGMPHGEAKFSNPDDPGWKL